MRRLAALSKSDADVSRTLSPALILLNGLELTQEQHDERLQIQSEWTPHIERLRRGKSDEPYETRECSVVDPPRMAADGIQWLCGDA